MLTPRKDGPTQSAILRWARQFEEMQDGENIHAKYNYPNPPILPQLLTPIFKLIEVSPAAGALTWFALKLGMAIVSLVWAFRLVRRPAGRSRSGRRWSRWRPPSTRDRRPEARNVNMFILFLVMATLYAFPAAGTSWRACSWPWPSRAR